MSLLIGWSSCQADYFSSSDEEDQLGDVCDYAEESEDNYEDFNLDLDGPYFDQDEDTENVKRKISIREALDILKENGGDLAKSAEAILDLLLGSDKQALSSQGNQKKNHKMLLLKTKLSKLDKANKSRKFRNKSGEKLLDETFENISQSSMLDMVKSQQATPDVSSQGDMEGTGEEDKSTRTVRKPLNQCKDSKKMKEKTDNILEQVVAEAEVLMVTPTALMSYLLHRLNYNNRRDFARCMFRLFKDDSWDTEVVGLEKALALVERRRLGKSGYRYIKKHLIRIGPQKDCFRSKNGLIGPLGPSVRTYKGQNWVKLFSPGPLQ